MRISDWSSDVCPSDLPAGGRGEESRRHQPDILAEILVHPDAASHRGDDGIGIGIAFLEQGARRFAAAREAVTLRDLAGRTKAELAEHRARRRIVDEMTRRQIGRAACRERVCQYV